MVDKEEEGEKKGFEIKASELDDKTHYELSLLYRESTESMRFAKSLQWKTLASSLLIYFATVCIANFSFDGRYYSKMQSIAVMLNWTCILVPIAATFMLALFQFWQHNELLKIDYINKQFSNMFSRVRHIKSKTEASVHRYIFLIFMIAAVIMGAWVAFTANQLILLKV